MEQLFTLIEKETLLVAFFVLMFGFLIFKLFVLTSYRKHNRRRAVLKNLRIEKKRIQKENEFCSQVFDFCEKVRKLDEEEYTFPFRMKSHIEKIDQAINSFDYPQRLCDLCDEYLKIETNSHWQSPSEKIEEMRSLFDCHVSKLEKNLEIICGFEEFDDKEKLIRFKYTLDYIQHEESRLKKNSENVEGDLNLIPS